MPERTRITVLVILASLHGAAAVILAPVDIFVAESFSDYVEWAVNGIFLVPPALLAVCAVFGPWSITARLPLATWLVCVLAILLTFAAQRGDFGNGLASDPSGELLSLYFGGPLVVFLVLLLPLALLRAVRRWRLEVSFVDAVRASEKAIASPSPPLARSSGQFTVKALFGWTLAAASIFAGLRWLFIDQVLTRDKWAWVVLEVILQSASFGVVLAVAGLPTLTVTWLLLASGRRPVLRLALIVGTAGGIAAMLVYYWSKDQDIGSLLASLEVGVIAAALGTVAMMRACGYRMVRRPRGATVAPRPVVLAALCPRRRFAWTLASLAVATIALACCVPAGLGNWRRAAETRRWAKLGLQVNWDDQCRLTCIQGDADRLTDDELRRFAELPDLDRLKFECLRDSQLAAIVAPAGLETLIITDFRFTDKGLEHLGRFPQLRDLDLSRTSITDAGLGRIAALKQLFRLKLSLTDITDDGLARRSFNAPIGALRGAGRAKWGVGVRIRGDRLSLSPCTRVCWRASFTGATNGTGSWPSWARCSTAHFGRSSRRRGLASG